MNEILTADETAELFRVSTAFVRSMANSGEIPGTKLGDDWRFIRQDMIDYLSERAKREQKTRKFNQKQTQKVAETFIPAKRGRPRKHSTQ